MNYQIYLNTELHIDVKNLGGSITYLLGYLRKMSLITTMASWTT